VGLHAEKQLVKFIYEGKGWGITLRITFSSNDTVAVSAGLSMTKGARSGHMTLLLPQPSGNNVKTVHASYSGN